MPERPAMMGEPTDDIQQAAGYKGAVPIIIVVGLVATSVRMNGKNHK